MKPKKLNFKDGSSLEIYESGAYTLRETKTVNPVLAARVMRPFRALHGGGASSQGVALGWCWIAPLGLGKIALRRLARWLKILKAPRENAHAFAWAREAPTARL
jgi:hypothetical protein